LEEICSPALDLVQSAYEVQLGVAETAMSAKWWQEAVVKAKEWVVSMLMGEASYETAFSVSPCKAVETARTQAPCHVL